VREGYPYAVAEAYRSWHDLDEKEVLELLDQI
jgi:predicted phosphoribosyltransferase